MRLAFEERFGDIAMTCGFIELATLAFKRGDADV
jgi:hypothetical protein